MPDDVMNIAAHINAAAAPYVAPPTPATNASGVSAQPGHATFESMASDVESMPAEGADGSFNFGPDYETKAAALIVRDLGFAKECAGFVKPEHFNNAVERNLVTLVLDFVRKYAGLPEPTTLVDLVKQSKDVIPAEHPFYVNKLITLLGLPLGERLFIRSKVVEFCCNQSLLRAAANIPDLLKKGEVDRIKASVDKAHAIGTAASSNRVDFFAAAEDRREYREKLSKGMKKRGVPTGFDEIDKHSYNGGWGRGEITVPMAPAKRGKTAFCLQSAAFSVIKHGTRALLLSLEVSGEIMQDRLDACIANLAMNDLVDSRDGVAAEIAKYQGRPGKLWVETRPANSFSTDQIDTLVESYFNEGHVIDLLVVDQLTVLRLATPDDRFVGLGTATKELRRIAGKYDMAVLSPTQTNRDALSKSIAGMDSVGESFQIVQDADLLLSINADAQMLAAGVRAINFAASRNQAEVTFKVKGDLAKMRLIEQVLSVDH